MILLDSKEMKLATVMGGSIGPAIRSSKQGGHLAGTIGIDISVKNSQMGTSKTVLPLLEFQNHIGISIQLSMFKYVFLMIPKIDIIEWGVLDYGSIPFTRTSDHSSALAGLLLYGPIGLLFGSAMDSAASKKQASKPVIGITFRNNDSESAIFIDADISSWFHYLYDFLMLCLPEKLKE